MLSAFVTCLTDELTKRGYGEKRQAEIVDRFSGLRESFVREGVADPDTAAMNRVLAEITAITSAKARVDYATLLKVSRAKTWIDDVGVNTAIFGATNEKGSPALVLNAMLSRDARFAHIPNVEMQQIAYRGQLWAAMNDVIEHASKGVMGIQRGKAHLDNLVDEIFGKMTGDNTAHVMAKSWERGSRMIVDLLNNVGGAAQHLDRWGLPQLQSLAKLVRNGRDVWVADHMRWLDWDRMTWPNGAPIEPDRRLGVLEKVYETLSSGGVVKLKPGDFHGNGSAMGNLLDDHRFMIFKDGAAWREMHDKYGDGSVIDVMLQYVEKMSHKIAMVDVFSANPDHMASTLKTMALKRANEMGDVAGKEAAAIIKNRFEPMFDVTMRRNAMDPESPLANVVLGTANILRSAQLSAAILAAVPGDFMTTAAWAMANGMGSHLPGIVGIYTKNMFSPLEMGRVASHAAYTMDEVVHTNFAKARFTGLAEMGPQWTNRLSDVVIRSTALTAHTNSLRWAVQAEFRNLIARSVNLEFDALPFKAIAERYGIDAAMWDRVRKLQPDRVDRIDPAELLTGNAAQRETALAFQRMLLTESRQAVPDTMMEPTVILKGDTRPDTFRGALLHSVAMYKNFPIAISLMYGRAAMAIEGRGGRLSYIAGLGASMLLAGATTMQLREMSKLNDPLPMNTPKFWGKALLASGAMSVWGDFIFGGVNNQRSSSDIAAGPIVGFVGDTAELMFGSMFQFADKMGTLNEGKDARTPWAAKLVEYASRYTPGVNHPFIRGALQREVFDSLRVLADPRGSTKMMQKERRRVKENGNESWWAPGTPAPQRLPDPSSMLGGRR